MSTGNIDLQNIPGEFCKTTAAMGTDCKGLYDSVCRVLSSGLGVADRRSAIEALGLRQALANSKTEMRWVHSEAMPADGLAKDSNRAHNVLLDFLTRGYWRLVRDDAITAAKKRKAAGRVDILDDGVIRDPVVPAADDLLDDPMQIEEYTSYVAGYTPLFPSDVAVWVATAQRQDDDAMNDFLRDQDQEREANLLYVPEHFH